MIKPQRPPFAGTKVPSTTTQTEIHKMLLQYGADGIRWTEEKGKITLEFYVETKMEGIPRQLMVKLHPPAFTELKRMWDSTANRYVKKDYPNSAVSMRLLHHYLKIKLALVAWNVRPFEEEFLSEILVPMGPGREPIRLIEALKSKAPQILGLPEIVTARETGESGETADAEYAASQSR